MMLAGVPVLAGVVAEVADPVRATGTDDLADRLERALDDGLALLRSRSTSARSSSPRSKTHPKGSPSFGHAPCPQVGLLS